MTLEERAKAAILRLTEANGDGIQSFTFDDLLREFIAFADAEAAAMRERAAGVADAYAEPTDTPNDFTDGFENAARKLARRIRALPATGEE